MDIALSETYLEALSEKNDLEKEDDLLELILHQPVCIRCNRDALGHCYTEDGRKQMYETGLCEECYFEVFGEELKNEGNARTEDKETEKK